MTGPRVDQVNVVVPDPKAASGFLGVLGIEVPDAPPGWGEHHRTIPTSDDGAFGVDLDGSAFAGWWGGLPPDFAGVVVTLRVDERGEVDRLHDTATTHGGRSLHAPFDAFWGARFAVVEGPGPIVVGLMSQPDPTLRIAPPDPETFAPG